MDKKGIYIHIPFCRSRCYYCDFYLITDLSVTQKYLNALKKEIEISSIRYKGNCFDTIFLGGGTPSILESFQIEEIINTLKSNFIIDEDTEVTIESNPEDFINDMEKLNELRQIGVNRLSLGIESFNDKELIFLSRNHNSEEAESVIMKAKDIFDNISIDLIYSLPEQNINEVNDSLQKALRLKISHISAYTLIYEKDTILYKDFLKNRFKPLPESTESDMYKLFSTTLLENGYLHYEVSNYSKPGYKSRHNLKYWNYSDYLGFGPSAHSFCSGKRWNNSANIIKYINSLNNNILPEENIKELSKQESILEFLMLGLRSEGVVIELYNRLFNSNFLEKFNASISELEAKGFGVLEKNVFRLTEKGYAVVDEIVSRYF